MHKFTKVAVSFLFLLSTMKAFAVDLTIGVAHFYPPFVMKADKKSFYGFDINLMNRVCKDLNVNCRYSAMTFNELHNALLRGSVDLAVSSIVITPARKLAVNFSIPYMVSNGRLIARKDVCGKKIYKDFLDNKRIGIEYGTVYHEYIEHLKPKNAKIVLKTEQSELIELLMHNQIDVAVMDNPSAIWWAIRSSGTAKVVGRPFKVGEGLGVAAAEKAKQYLPNINRAILKWQKDGSFEKSYNHYFHPEHHQ